MGNVTQTVTFDSDGTQLSAYLSRPAGDGPFPAVVVIHEVFGLNDDIRGIADRLAGEGYAALAVDLFAGRNRAICMARFMGGVFLNSFDHQGIHDLRNALSLFADYPFVDAARLGAIGFCMGGSFAVAWACTDPRLKVIAPFYSFNPRPVEAVARACPVVGSFPAPDPTTGQGRKLSEVLQQYDVQHDIVIYQGTKHSFFNQGPTFDVVAADDAWRRTIAFFREQIG